jgi:hypothetical protein
MKTFGIVELEFLAFLLSAQDGVNGQLLGPATFPSGKGHRYPSDARTGGPQSQSSRFGI